MASQSQIAYIAQRARALGLDPAAVLAIAGHEGLGGGIGDGGHAFGPFQENNAGGVLTGRFPGLTPQQLNAWAWSPQGINDALTRIASVARGLKGNAAITAIASKFERPANVNAEIADAESHYGQFGGGSSSGRTPGSDPGNGGSTPSLPMTAGGTPSRQQLAALLMAQQPIDFHSNQIQTPNLMALAQLRQAASTGLVSGSRSTTSARTTAAGTFKPGYPVADLTRISGEHPTEGLPGFPAHDYFAPSGSTVVAPISGKVVRLSGHDPRVGPIEGPHGPLGWSVYIQGTDGKTYYLTHMGSRSVKVGETLRAGQPIGTVADYARYGTPSHIHMGVS